jgi:hypothetical protein
LLYDGGGEAAPAQEGPEFLPALATIGVTDQAGPAFCGLCSRRCQHILCSKILLYGVLDKRAAKAALLQLPAQALRAVTTAGEACT